MMRGISLHGLLSRVSLFELLKIEDYLSIPFESLAPYLILSYIFML